MSIDLGILQNVIHVSRVFINLDIKETVDFLNKLQRTNIGSLISQIDDPTFDWKLLRTVLNLKSTNEEGVFFLVGKIMEVIDDPEWWYFSCVCGQAIIGDDNVFRCQSCSADVENFTRRKVNSPCYRGTLKILDVYGDASSFPTPPTATACNDIMVGTVFTPIFPNYIPYAHVQDYKNQVLPVFRYSWMLLRIYLMMLSLSRSGLMHLEIWSLEALCLLQEPRNGSSSPVSLCGTPISHVADIYYRFSCGLECVNAIPSYRLKVLVSHPNGNNFFILDDAEVSQIVNIECSDFLQDKPMVSNATSDVPSTSRLAVNSVSPKSVCSSGSPFPDAVTIGEELEAHFGKPKIDEPPAKMDETSG
ncbi:hypothetical protein PIB30_027949 [Stylosanthes scabra]|uniref:Replication factor A C-terminal domain-containing protein n=1 Tax=Stylosanthes scabra TaxID=79078 RepID=A0ABU6SB08_9FABA|nr:hypothetical protein [Stylosanthes scabra]